MNPLVRRVATRFLGWRRVNGAVRSLARVRGHRLVLVYHNLGTVAARGCEIVPSVPVDVFRAQVQALGDVVDLVTLDDIIRDEPHRSTEGRARRPAVALTFDDDLPSHVEHALPVLRNLGVPAAFFLSGRGLHGLGPYWFQHLEALLIAHGERHTAALLGVADVGVEGLMRACEGSAALRRRVIERAADVPSPRILEPDAMPGLIAAGMTIGFHTLDHDALPDLDDRALDDAVSRGRDQLAQTSSGEVRYFAYPHGKADTRSAAAVRHAAFDAAFTGKPQPVRPGEDRYRLGRWEPGPLAVDDLLVKLAWRLHGVGLTRGTAGS